MSWQSDINDMKQLMKLSYKGKDVTTTTGAAEELVIPAGSTVALLSCAGEGYVEVNADATTSSPIYLKASPMPYNLPLGGVTKLSAWAVSGKVGAVFMGYTP